jgi:uncharacterized membrane protein
MVASPSLLFLGVVLVLVGVLLMKWASSRDLKDAAIGAALGAAWTLLRRRKRPGMPEELSSRVNEVRSQETHLGKAKVVTGFAVKHVVAQVATVIGLLFLAVGALVVAVGVFWR